MLGPPLLDTSDHSVREHDAGNHKRVGQMVMDAGDNGCGQEHVNEEVVELHQEPHDRAASRHSWQEILPMTRRPSDDLLTAKARNRGIRPVFFAKLVDFADQ